MKNNLDTFKAALKASGLYKKDYILDLVERAKNNEEFDDIVVKMIYNISTTDREAADYFEFWSEKFKDMASAIRKTEPGKIGAGEIAEKELVACRDKRSETMLAIMETVMPMREKPGNAIYEAQQAGGMFAVYALVIELANEFEIAFRDETWEENDFILTVEEFVESRTW